jgi:hypothetical protein
MKHHSVLALNKIINKLATNRAYVNVDKTIKWCRKRQYTLAGNIIHLNCIIDYLVYSAPSPYTPAKHYYRQLVKSGNI